MKQVCIPWLFIESSSQNGFAIFQESNNGKSKEDNNNNDKGKVKNDNSKHDDYNKRSPEIRCG